MSIPSSSLLPVYKLCEHFVLYSYAVYTAAMLFYVWKKNLFYILLSPLMLDNTNVIYLAYF